MRSGKKDPNQFERGLTTNLLSQKEYERRKMLVNRQGDIILLLIVQDSDYEQSDPEVTMAESTSNKPCQIEF